MPRAHRHVNRNIPPWRGPMLAAFIVLLLGVLILQQSPKKAAPAPRSTTTTQLTQKEPSSVPPSAKTLQISSGPTWVPLGSLHTLTLQTSALPSIENVAVSLEVFPRIVSRSQFHYLTKNGLTSLPIASSPPMNLSQLSRNETGNPELPFIISQSAPTGQARAGHASYIQVPYCSPNCEGVYPLLAIFVKGSQIIGTALTDIVVAPSSPVAQPLNFALVVNARFTGNQKNDLADFSLLAGTLAANPQAALTLNVPGIILSEALSSPSPSVKASVTELVNWANQPHHELVSSEFVPLNLPQIQSSGLESIIPDERAASMAAADTFFHKQVASPGLLVVHGGLTQQNLDTLSKMGVSQVSLSDKSFLPFNGKYTLSKPFILSGSGGSQVTVLSNDSELTADIGNGPLPYDGSNKLASDLSQIYFDQPNDVSPRVVSASYAVSNSSDAATLNQVLSNLSSSPFIKTVDIQHGFSLTPLRNLSRGKLTQPQKFRPLNLIDFAKTQSDINALSSSFEHSTLLLQAKSDLLASVASTITPSNAANYIRGARSSVASVSNMISLAENKAFTVTSRKVQLPIAITSQLKVPFKGVLVINSDRLSFPNGNTIPVLLNSPNTTLSIPIYAETLGLYLISAKLFTTNGQLVVAHTSIEIRSTAFSAVSVVLTLGAIAILAFWWIRSFRKGHRRNRRLMGEEN